MASNNQVEYEYNPIKEQINGKEAERIIWSTNSIYKALDGIQKGQPLKATPFLNKNTKLLKPELVYKRTKEEIDDYIKCKMDPVYFASKCYLMTPEGLRPCVLRDYQIEYLRHLQKNRFSIFLSCRQSGKSTTTAIYCLWVILFNTDKQGLVLSKSGPAGVDLIKKIKDMYLYLPYHLKIGTLKWNQSEISFDNNSSISTEAFSPTAGLGKTINFLILDEFAWCPPNDVELFYNNIIPTVTTISDANVCIMSTQNGFNKFYELWKGSVEGRNIYAPFKVDWQQVPQFNKKTKKWEKRTQAWKDEMVGILGSEEAFQYQYGTMFSASDYCLVSRECLSNIRDKAVLWDNRIEDLEEAGFGFFINHIQNLYWRPDFDLNELRTGYFAICDDLAEGSGQDFTPFNIFQLVEKDKWKHVGRWYANNVDLENAALEFWLLVGQLFNSEHCIWSLEWNTYGALFYNILMNLNEPDYDEKSSYRNNICPEGIELSNFVMYEKTSIEDQLVGKQGKRKQTKKYIPGIKFTPGNKGTYCSLLKMKFERGLIDTNDLITIGELENFEDKNGNGSYKASSGHDDSIMTFVQIPALEQTPKYKAWVEEFETSSIMNNVNNNWNQDNQYLGDYSFENGLNTDFSMLETGLYSNNSVGGTFDIFTTNLNR